MNATQWVGIFAFGIAALSCFWVRWRLIAAVNAALSLECVFGLRHGIHDIGEQIIGQPYPGRDGIKVALIIVGLVLLAGLISSLLRAKSRSERLLSTVATSTALVLFCIEMVSLEAIDALVYQPFGGVLAIGWLWLALGLFTAIGALRQLNRRNGGAKKNPPELPKVG